MGGPQHVLGRAGRLVPPLDRRGMRGLCGRGRARRDVERRAAAAAGRDDLQRQRRRGRTAGGAPAARAVPACVLGRRRRLRRVGG
eukprot:2067354-Prymnesium_polylepis.1